jgi:hypothetical protein
MKHVKTFEGFFDFFKPKNEVESHLMQILERLEKAKSESVCPYEIKGYFNEFPEWIKSKNYGTHHIYEVKFDDITIAVDSASYMTPSHRSLNMTELYFTETDMNERNVEPEKLVRESIAEKFWNVLSYLKKRDDKNKSSKKSSERLGSMINPSADLL